MAVYNSWADDVESDDDGGTVDAGTVSPWADDSDDDDGDDGGTVDLSGSNMGGDLLDAYDDDSDDTGSTTTDLTTTDDGSGSDSGADDEGDDIAGTIDNDRSTDYGLDDDEDLPGGNLAGGSNVTEQWNEATGLDWGSSGDGSEGDVQLDDVLAEQQAAYEARIESLMNDLPIPDRLGGSIDGGGLSPTLGAVALLAVGGGALYYSEAS
ncbi:hypothetical protein [Halorubrum sp. HHNYT27]|uniref:hypothetical protein n=1 Tax=Halorubrum sp. HHNYT27 TaxID=3402275 RepID=UPI003EBCFFA2